MIEVKRVEEWKTSDGLGFPAKAQAQAHEAAMQLANLVDKNLVRGTAQVQNTLDFLDKNQDEVYTLLGYIIDWRNISKPKGPRS